MSSTEDEQRRRSDEIDAELKQDAERLKQERNMRTLLLIGQAGAGKSTILKQFKYKYAPEEFQRERLEWKPIVYLQVLQQLRKLLTHLETRHVSSLADEKRYRARRLKLGPLIKLAVAFRDSIDTGRSQRVPIRNPRNTIIGSEVESDDDEEIIMTSCWKERLSTRLVISCSRSEPDCAVDGAIRKLQHDADIQQAKASTLNEALLEAARLFSSCEAEIRSLVKEAQMLDQQTKPASPTRMYAQQASDNHIHTDDIYFLEQVSRICETDYIPTPDDILKCRVRTVGITITDFQDETGVPFRIIDSGGGHGQRAVWAQFFSESHAIIFLAPLSNFDETLATLPEQNAFTDTLTLFGKVVRHPLLTKAAIILFLNKVDVLLQKIERGLNVRQYLPNYYKLFALHPPKAAMKAIFVDMYAQENAVTNTRAFYQYYTTAVDTAATQRTIVSVKEAIMSSNLKRLGLL